MSRVRFCVAVAVSRAEKVAGKSGVPNSITILAPGLGMINLSHRRARVGTTTALLILLKNLLISREPLYGVGEWSARHAPELLGLTST